MSIEQTMVGALLRVLARPFDIRMPKKYLQRFRAILGAVEAVGLLLRLVGF